VSYTCALYGRSRGAKVKNSSGASLMDVWRSKHQVARMLT
jgi:hypothetical protein